MRIYRSPEAVGSTGVSNADAKLVFSQHGWLEQSLDMERRWQQEWELGGARIGFRVQP